MTLLSRYLKKIIVIQVALAMAAQVDGQSFNGFLSRLNALPESARQAVADSFMHAGHPLPFTENDTIVHFVYNSPAQSVALAGDATGWNPDKYFTRVAGCNFRYFSTAYENDARLDYKLVTDSTNWILDPANPNTSPGGYGPNSELRMPSYAVPPEISYYSSIPHGTLKDTTFHSAKLGNSRAVRVYLPPGYSSGSQSYPVVLFHDGLDYISLSNATNILDYLIAQHQMAPVIAVFVPPVDRSAEYAGARIDLFTAFIITELMPVIDKRYRTSKDPAKRAMAGASDGGNISLYIGMKHPEQFGKIAAQSSDVITAISTTFSTGPKLALDLYIDIGTYDIAILIPMVHNLRDILQARGYAFQYKEWHEGHSWGNWKGHLKHPLTRFFPYTTGMNETPPSDIMLKPARPNPFRDHTIIPFTVPAGSNVSLNLVDMTGNIIETIFSGLVPKSDNLVEYHHHKAAGIYILTLKLDEKVKSTEIIQAL